MERCEGEGEVMRCEGEVVRDEGEGAGEGEGEGLGVRARRVILPDE